MITHLKKKEKRKEKQNKKKNMLFFSQGIGTTRWMAPEVLRKMREEFSRFHNDDNQNNNNDNNNNNNHNNNNNYNQPRGYDCSADIFSFAMVLYEIIEEKIPYDEIIFESKVEETILNGERPSFSSKSNKYPEKIKELIIKGWNEDGRERPSAKEMLEEI